MRSAAYFLGIFAHGVHLYFFAVLIGKQTYRALSLGFFDSHFLAYHGNVGGNRFIYQFFDFGNFFLCERTGKSKVETKSLFGNVASLLVCVFVV